jgi:Family of unknown function (DUF6049)
VTAVAPRVVVAAALGVLAVPVGLAQGDPSVDRAASRPGLRQPSAELTLELTETTFAVAPDATWHSVYTVSGTVPGLVPPTTPATSTTSTAPPTTAPRRPGAPPGSRRGRAATARPAAPRVDARLRVVLYRSIDERTELASAVAGDRPNEIDRLDLPVDRALTARGGTTTLTVDAPTTTEPNPAAAPLSMRLPGLYPIGVQLLVDGEVVAEHHSFVERLATDGPTGTPLNVAVLAATDDPGPAPTPTEIAEGRRNLDAIADVATRSAGPVSVAIPPVLAANLPADVGTTIAAALDDAELLSLPADELDPSSAVAIGEAATFTRELREGEDALAEALPTSPARRSAWVATSPISAAAAIELRNLGFRLLILDDATYTSLDGNIGGYQDPSLAVDVDIGDGSVLPALVVAPAARLLDSEYLRSAEITSQDAAVQLLAEMLTLRRDLGARPRRSMVLATPDIGVPDGDAVAAFTSLAASVPDIAMVPLSVLAGATDTMRANRQSVTVQLPAEAGPDLADRAQRIALTRLSAESAASMLVDEAQAQAWRAELDTLLSTGLDDATVDAALGRISAQADAVRDSVAVPEPFPFTLTGRDSVLRLRIRNDADEPRRIVVRARSPKLTFPDGDLEVELAPAANTEVELPVVARSNGTSSVEVELLTPAFDQTVDGPVILTSRVNALTGLGQVITGGALLVLVSWWFGHFRRRRRGRLDEAFNGAINGGVISPDAAEAIAGPSGAHSAERR